MKSSPDVQPGVPRASVASEIAGGPPIVIVGAGFAGLCMAIRLKQAGIDDFEILEEAAEVGGTWRDNRYPGAACDVESHLYSFSFELNPNWSRTFASQPEILEYLLHCTEKFGLRPYIRFGVSVTRAEYDDGAGRWALETAAGETRYARALVLCCGGLSRPAYPEIAGLADFKGQIFHSARWDRSAVLEGKKVAVIGTGASAIQIVPAIAPQVETLAVYQRSAPWILPKPDRAISGLGRAIFRRAPFFQRLLRLAIYWRREAMAVGFVVWPAILKLAERLALRNLAHKVRDRSLEAKLIPSYAMGCKRILPTNDYYNALTGSHVELVTEPIDRVQPHSILARDGKDRPVDVIVLATGFRASEPMAPFEIVGRGGRRIEDVWGQGAEAYLGTAVSGFPNLFFIVGPNTGVGHGSMVFMIEAQARYILSSMKAMLAGKIDVVEVRPDVQSRYNESLGLRLRKTVWASGCTSWYRTRAGKNTTLWPGFTFEFRMRTRRFDPESYDIRVRK